jgi:hypothetical protein
MSQFDIHANPFARSRKRQPFLVILQSDLISWSLDTVVVAPLEEASGGKFADRLRVCPETLGWIAEFSEHEAD